ncbi:MAG: hypothetical protein ABI594_05710 [Ginsengibacter sp.]
MEEEYKCQIYYVLSAFVIALSVTLILVLSAIFLWLTEYVSGLLPILVLTLCFIIQFSFKKKIKNVFTKNCVLKFNNSAFCISIYSLSNSAVKTVTIYWEQLKGYKINFTESEFTVLDFYLKKKLHKKFVFIDNKNEEESINGESIFSILRSHIKQINSASAIDKQIKFVPGFLATNRGLYTLWILGVLAIAAFILHIIKNNNDWPMFGLGIMFFLPLIFVRKDQQRLYNKIKSLD